MREITDAEAFLLDIKGPITNQNVIDAYNEGVEDAEFITLDKALSFIDNELLLLNNNIQRILNKSFIDGDNNFKIEKAKLKELNDKYKEAKEILKQYEDIKLMWWKEEKRLYKLDGQNE